jgi:hypothetical protein
LAPESAPEIVANDTRSAGWPITGTRTEPGRGQRARARPTVTSTVTVTVAVTQHGTRSTTTRTTTNVRTATREAQMERTRTNDLHKLDVYRCALDLYRRVGVMVARFPHGEADLRSQMKRASRSVPHNIGEGVGRRGRARAASYEVALGEAKGAHRRAGLRRNRSARSGAGGRCRAGSRGSSIGDAHQAHSERVGVRVGRRS